MTERTHSLPSAFSAVSGVPIEGALKTALVAFAKRATSGHPDLADAMEPLAALLARALGDQPPEDWPSRIERLVAPDLLLAAGLSVSDRYAIGEFEEHLVPAITSTLQRMRLEPADVAEMVQAVRVHVLVPDAPEKASRISGYGGRGSLEGWVRTTTMRFALRKLDKADRNVGPKGLEHVRVQPRTEPGGRRSNRHQQLRAAVSDAFAELPPKTRRLLRARYVEGRTASVLAREYAVHASTMSRWLNEARQTLAARIRDRARVLVGHEDVDGARLLETLAADVEASLRGLFDTRPPK